LAQAYGPEALQSSAAASACEMFRQTVATYANQPEICRTLIASFVASGMMQYIAPAMNGAFRY
jgi:hypothetical protein